MKPYPLFATGQGLLPFFILGIPAAILGLTCIGVALVLGFKSRKAGKKTVLLLGSLGILLILLAFISPTLDPLVIWAGKHFKKMR